MNFHPDLTLTDLIKRPMLKRYYVNLDINQNSNNERVEIKIKISLDENKVPEQIHWTAEMLVNEIKNQKQY